MDPRPVVEAALAVTLRRPPGAPVVRMPELTGADVQGPGEHR
ncbi:hypothetical protein [Kitasatospora sp. CB01950]|nr:hypothetical protein [Kitasatospora sp. CB01950]